MKDIHATFEYGRFYHVFNRTNNKEILFRSDENKRYFLMMIEKRLKGFVKFYAYALLGTHFHFSISICSEEEIIAHILTIPKFEQRKTEMKFLNASAEERDVHKLVSRQLSRACNSYAQAYNKLFGREGNLFHSPFKRCVINIEDRFSHLTYYIHHNSRHHRLINDFLYDPWHSYHEIISDADTFVEKQFVLDWFGGRDEFIKFHDGRYLGKDFRNISIEE